jgi:secreted protein with Ig-like and vWFA domain
VRAGYDPDRVNVVLLLTDGMNDDVNSITMDQLLSTLAAEQDPARPVPVISIAFGPDSDVAALQQISRATGGATYLSQDPRQIGEIFLDAVGQRLCRPSC